MHVTAEVLTRQRAGGRITFLHFPMEAKEREGFSLSSLG